MVNDLIPITKIQRAARKWGYEDNTHRYTTGVDSDRNSESFLAGAMWMGEQINKAGIKVVKTKKYTFFWLDGTVNVYEGTDPANALNNAGYGQGALGALDFHGSGDIRHNWKWDEGRWVPADND